MSITSSNVLAYWISEHVQCYSSEPVYSPQVVFFVNVFLSIIHQKFLSWREFECCICLLPTKVLDFVVVNTIPCRSWCICRWYALKISQVWILYFESCILWLLCSSLVERTLAGMLFHVVVVVAKGVFLLMSCFVLNRVFPICGSAFKMIQAAHFVACVCRRCWRFLWSWLFLYLGLFEQWVWIIGQCYSFKAGKLCGSKSYFCSRKVLLSLFLRVRSAPPSTGSLDSSVDWTALHCTALHCTALHCFSLERKPLLKCVTIQVWWLNLCHCSVFVYLLLSIFVWETHSSDKGRIYCFYSFHFLGMSGVRNWVLLLLVDSLYVGYFWILKNKQVFCNYKYGLLLVNWFV